MSDNVDVFCLQVTAMAGSLNSPLTASFPFSWSSGLALVRELIASHKPETSSSVRAQVGPHTP